jgi:arylsulfatase A-like enzyme
MRKKITRRDFLKFSLSLPFFRFNFPDIQNRNPYEQSENNSHELPNILILVFDALSAGNCSLSGYHRQTTPNLERFAARSTVFHKHRSAGNFTMPGTASLLTGTYPWSHRGYHLFGDVLDAYKDKNIFSELSNYFHTIAYTHNPIAALLLNQFIDHLDEFVETGELGLYSDLLSDHLFPKDYNKAYWGEMVFRDSIFYPVFHSIWRYFYLKDLTSEYSGKFPRGIPYNSVALHFTLEQAIDWIQIQIAKPSKPYLGYFHLFPPHEPYTTRKDFIDIFDDGWTPDTKAPHYFTEGYSREFLIENRRHYDEYVAYADSEIGRLYDYMEDNGVIENTYVIITSDHGQMFERGIHAHNTPTLYEPVIWVPLLISSPGQTERRDVYTPTSSVDLLPTLLHAIGHPIPNWIEGQVLPTFSEIAPDSDRSIYAIEAKSNSQHGPLTEATVSINKGPYKLIHYFGYEGHENVFELYNLEKDPEELENLFTTKTSLAKELQSELLEKLDEANQ